MSINAYNASTISALFAGLNNSSSGTSLSYGIDFTTYKQSQEKALKKFEYYKKMMDELRKTLEEEIKPLLSH